MREETSTDSTHCQQSKSEVHRAQASHKELVERLMWATHNDGIVEPLQGLRFRRVSSPTGLAQGVSAPAFSVIVQGTKEILLGDNRYQYNPGQYLIATGELPIASRIIVASPERPYLGLVLKLDPTLVGSALVEAGHLTPQTHSVVTPINTSSLDAGLLDAVTRLVRLLDSPTETRLLAPLITREIVYRLLMGPQSDRLGQITLLGGSLHRIAEAVERLRQDFDQPLRIKDIAHELGMSISGFHHHFRIITAMSPLQFQKHLRLQEARRLMLGEGLDAASAGHRVGYGSISHFVREYKRLFGAPPVRDMERLRESAKESVDQGIA